MKMACNSNAGMHGTAYSRLNHSVSAQNDSSYCNMSSGCNKKFNQQSSGGSGSSDSSDSSHNSNNNNSSSKYVTESKQNSNQLISSNKCQKPMLNTVLRLTHNCRYVNAAAILLITLNILATLSPCDAFLLDGSQNSFAQFRKWYTGLNGSLEFEFKTEQPNGLVVYTGKATPFELHFSFKNILWIYFQTLLSLATHAPMHSWQIQSHSAFMMYSVGQLSP